MLSVRFSGYSSLRRAFTQPVDRRIPVVQPTFIQIVKTYGDLG